MKDLKKPHKINGRLQCVTDDEKLILTLSHQNNIFLFDGETLERVFKAKTLKCANKAAISHDKKLIAVKNTQGDVAVISVETGEEVFRCHQWYLYGNIFFTKDDKYIINLDINGRMGVYETDGFNIPAITSGRQAIILSIKATAKVWIMTILPI